MTRTVRRIAPPAVLALVLLVFWEAMVRLNGTPEYILPGPLSIGRTLWSDWPVLWPSLLVTLQITFLALLVEVLGGGGLAVLFALSPTVERALFPFAVVLQVTPVVAVAPLILIYVENTLVAVVLVAWIVAFFPVLSNSVLGLNSVDHNLRDLFALYGAGRWRTLRLLRIPAAMGIVTAASTIWWTSSGTPALSRPSNSVSSVWNAKRVCGVAARVVSSTIRRPAVRASCVKAAKSACRVMSTWSR